MAVSNITLLITVALLSIIFSSYGFVVPSNSQRVNKFPSVLRMSEEDVVGVGEEIATDYPGLKLSKLKEIEGNIAEFQLDFEVAGKDSQKVYSEIQKQAKKNANFPGFRKGQLPAYALAELKSFTLEQVINDAILNACDYCKLDVVEEGESAKAEILEDMTDLGKKFKVGQPFTFRATVVAAREEEEQKEEGVEAAAAAAVAEVVDAEVVAEEKE